MKKIIAIMLVMLIAFSMLFAGGSSETATTETTSEIQKGGRMVISCAAPTTRAWYDIRGIMAVAEFGIIYEPLARYGSDGSPEPFLAESITPDSTALTWTIKVRKGVKFSDGSDLNAEVVKWNLDFYAEKGVLRSSFFKFYDYAECTDDYTVVCHFSQWDSLFDYSLCRTVLVASKLAYDTYGEEWLVNHPVGTGPFVEKEFNADVSWILDKNDNYWQGEVNLDGIDLITYQQELVAATALSVGQIDAMLTENYSLVEQVKNYKNITVKAADLPSYYYTLCFNMQEGDPCANVLVRKAISYAINVDDILDTLTFGYALKTNQWAPESSPFYNTEVEGQEYNLEKAKELLTEAGYPNGFKTTLTLSATDLPKNVAQVIKEQLAKIGIDVTIRSIEGAAFANYIGAWEEGMFLHTMGAEAGAASQYASTFYNYEGFGLGVNAFEISDELDAITTSITSAKTEEERNEYTRQVAKIVVDDECMIKVLFGSRAIAFTNNKIKNSHYCDVQNLRIDVWEAYFEK